MEALSLHPSLERQNCGEKIAAMVRGTCTKDAPAQPPKLGVRERKTARATSLDAALLAKKSTDRAKRLWAYLDYKTMDVFGHYPNYTFPGYRSSVGAFSSIFLFLGIFLRLVTTASDFVYSEPVISEDTRIFASDGNDPFAIPKVGLVFKKTGWKPFYDPTYFNFRFRQGYAGMASNSSYEDLADTPCSFVDIYGRIVEDEARCPAGPSTMLGNFFDRRFEFLHIAVMRCHNGTDADGKSVPGPCRTPAEIDALVWDGTITLMLEQKDLTPQASFPTKSLIRLKKQFRDYVHATYDMRFMVRFVTIQPRAFFDQFDPNAKQNFLVLDRTDTSYTDYRPVKLGMWNKPDPAYVPQYAAFYLLLGDEYVDQQRAWYSVFRLVESWGASVRPLTRPLYPPYPLAPTPVHPPYGRSW